MTGFHSDRDEDLLDLYDRMIGDRKIDDVLRTVADVACRSLEAERATVYLLDESTRELRSAAVIGNVPRTIRIPVDKTSLAGYCAETGRSFVVPDAYGDLSAVDPELGFDRSWDDLTGFRTREVMCAPALFRKETLGVLQVLNRKNRPFERTDLPDLERMSRLVGYALYNARACEDLKTMKKLEEEKARFMRIMVHELKSPVAAVIMMTEVIRDMKSDPTKTEGMMDRISGRLDQMNRLIADILEFARVRSGAPLGEIRVLDLTAETERICGPFLDEAEDKGLAADLDLPGESVRVRFDSQGFSLVLSNLVGNAVKYTERGSIRVGLRSEKSWAVLEVCDTGIGVPEKEVPRLFSEFYRASNARKSNIPGSGVGLAGVKSIVERFGGHMELESRENRGSLFRIRLPHALSGLTA